jgi:hypothetical protein
VATPTPTPTPTLQSSIHIAMYSNCYNTVWYGSILLRCLCFLTALFDIVVCMKMLNSSDCQKDITLLHLCVLYNSGIIIRRRKRRRRRRRIL